MFASQRRFRWLPNPARGMKRIVPAKPPPRGLPDKLAASARKTSRSEHARDRVLITRFLPTADLRASEFDTGVTTRWRPLETADGTPVLHWLLPSEVAPSQSSSVVVNELFAISLFTSFCRPPRPPPPPRAAQPSPRFPNPRGAPGKPKKTRGNPGCL